MNPELIRPVKPFMSVVEKLGALASQIVEGAVSKVTVEYSGEVAENEVSPLTTTVLKGLLTPMMDVVVNFVNAPFIAKERGIEVIEIKSKEAKGFASLISVRIKSSKAEREVGGTAFAGIGDRLVSIDGFRVNADPSGYMLILSNIDKPGKIGKVGTLLGKNKINIASMQVGRITAGKKAVMVLNVDGAVTDKVLKEILKIDGIFDAIMVKL